MCLVGAKFVRLCLSRAVSDCCARAVLYPSFGYGMVPYDEFLVILEEHTDRLSIVDSSDGLQCVSKEEHRSQPLTSAKTCPTSSTASFGHLFRCSR